VICDTVLTFVYLYHTGMSHLKVNEGGSIRSVKFWQWNLFFFLWNDRR